MDNLETESFLEQNLIKKLKNLGYEQVEIKNEETLKNNLKLQLEKFNEKELENTKLTQNEFERIYNEINTGSNFDRAILLRNKSFQLKRNERKITIKYFNSNNPTENIFQVANQITVVNERKTRYDVTILINGFPMVQIELKRKGGELSKAFKQINKYKEESYKDLFKFIQIFIISTGNQTKYFSTTDETEKLNSKFAFYWSDEENNRINDLLKEENGKKSFVDSFLKPYQLGKMIAKYMIISKKDETIKILRPYQFYAVEKILKRIKDTEKGGFVWHTTGSGKTLTSFKAAQEIKNNIDKIDKVFFVVDRRDLNNQTFAEFQSFDGDESIISIKNSKELIKEIKSDSNNLVITTLQKFDKAIKELNAEKIPPNDSSRQQKVVFIFDECHRSQFGKTNKLIKEYFVNNQMIGFTGTPIKAVNSNQYNQTTKQLFDDKLLHSYKISEAIDDKNVLGFSVEYFKTYDLKKTSISIGEESTAKTPNRKEVLEDERRIKNIVENIFKIHNKKTNNREFNAMFTVANINLLRKYYEEFARQNELQIEENKLKIASIFSTNNDDDIEDGEISDEIFLKRIIDEYYQSIDWKSPTGLDSWFNTYRANLMKNIKNNSIDIILVVNMFTTGFDAPKLNTLYVDKNLEYHGLLQAFSRTNRIDNENKTQGNIVVYSRPNKQTVDLSIREFSNEDGMKIILKESYEFYIKKVNQLIEQLVLKHKNPDALFSSKDEKQKAEFIKEYRELLSNLNLSKSFFEFSFDDISSSEQELKNFNEAYLKIYREEKENQKNGKESIINEIDFRIELLFSDKIDHRYIEKLLTGIDKSISVKEYKEKLDDLMEKIDKQSTYNPKLINLIKKFINEQFDKIETLITNEELITYDKLDNFLIEERKTQLKQLIAKFKFDPNSFENLIEYYEINHSIDDEFLENLLIKEEIKEEILLKSKEEGKKVFVYREEVKSKLATKIEEIYETTNLVIN